MDVIGALLGQVKSIGLDIVKLTIWLLILSAIFVPLERIWSIHKQQILRKNLPLDLTYYFLNTILTNLLLAVPMATAAWALHRIVPNPIQTFGADLPFGWRFPVALVVGECATYWAHRAMHEVKWLWPLHAVHHSAREIDWLVNVRAHPLDLVFTRFCGFVPLYALGLAQPTAANLADPVTLGIIFTGTVWQFLIHANLRWRFGWLEYLFVMPAFHHWHHTRHDHINHNYSTVLPWMDMIFGTFYLPKDRLPDAYGIDTPMPDTLTGQLLYPLQGADEGGAEKAGEAEVSKAPPA